MSIAHPLGDKSSIPPNPSEAPTRPDTWTLVGWWMDKRVEWVRTLAVARPAMLQWTLNSNTSPLETEERASIFNKHEYIRVKAGKYSTQCKLLTRNYTRVIQLYYLYTCTCTTSGYYQCDAYISSWTYSPSLLIFNISIWLRLDIFLIVRLM